MMIIINPVVGIPNTKYHKFITNFILYHKSIWNLIFDNYRSQIVTALRPSVIIYNTLLPMTALWKSTFQNVIIPCISIVIIGVLAWEQMKIEQYMVIFV